MRCHERVFSFVQWASVHWKSRVESLLKGTKPFQCHLVILFHRDAVIELVSTPGSRLCQISSRELDLGRSSVSGRTRVPAVGSLLSVSDFSQTLWTKQRLQKQLIEPCSKLNWHHSASGGLIRVLYTSAASTVLAPFGAPSTPFSHCRGPCRALC